MSRRALLLINPNARRGGDNHEALSRILCDGGLELVSDRGESEPLSDAIVRHQHDVDLVIVGGGDGTLREAIPGLVQTGLPLGLLPLGTANDLARSLSLPLDPHEACQMIVRGEAQSIDVADANGHYFFNVASIGLSADITRRLDPAAKRRWGVFAYLKTAFATTFKVRPFHAEIRAGDDAWQVKSVQIAVGNGRHYGGGMTVAEEATINDGLLHLFSVEVRHWWQVFLITPRLRRGTLDTSRWARTLSGTEFEIITRRRRAVTIDGELATYTPVRIRLHRQAIRVFA